MTNRVRRRFTPEYTEQAVARLAEAGVCFPGVAAELGVTATQLKAWELELNAAGSTTTIGAQRAEAADLAQLRRELLDAEWFATTHQAQTVIDI